MPCFFRLKTFNPPNKSQQQKKKLFGIGREDLTNLSRVQPTYLGLLLIPQIHIPYKGSTIYKGNNLAKLYCQKVYQFLCLVYIISVVISFMFQFTGISVLSHNPNQLRQKAVHVELSCRKSLHCLLSCHAFSRREIESKGRIQCSLLV